MHPRPHGNISFPQFLISIPKTKLQITPGPLLTPHPCRRGQHRRRLHGVPSGVIYLQCQLGVLAMPDRRQLLRCAPLPHTERSLLTLTRAFELRAFRSWQQTCMISDQRQRRDLPPAVGPNAGDRSQTFTSWLCHSAPDRSAARRCTVWLEFNRWPPALPPVKCRPRPRNAQCMRLAGGARVVPQDGYWHSAANSTELHVCPRRGACKCASGSQTSTFQRVHGTPVLSCVTCGGFYHCCRALTRSPLKLT